MSRAGFSSVFSKNAISNGLTPADNFFSILSPFNHEPIRMSGVNWAKLRNMWQDDVGNIDLKQFGKTRAEQILGILSHNTFRKGKLKQIDLPTHGGVFLDQIQHSIDHGRPIELVMPSFPFRITNPLKSSRGEPGLAEASAFAKLHSLVEQIKRVYPKGAVVRIAQDGVLYCACFKHGHAYAKNYEEQMNKILHSMGLTGEIKLFDLKVAMEKQPDYKSSYQRAHQEVLETLRNPGTLAQTIQHLYSSAAANIRLPKVPQKDIERIFQVPESQLTPNQLLAKIKITNEAAETVQTYLTINRTLELLDIYKRVTPRALRASIHPGPGKFGLQLHRSSTNLLPWMGVGILDSKGATVKYEMEVKHNPKYRPIFVGRERTPFAYLEKGLYHNQHPLGLFRPQQRKK